MAFRTIQIDLDDASFQAALNRATGEGKAIGQIVAEYLKQYAGKLPTGSPGVYVVQRGDTLGRIARKVYGDAHQYPVIQRANKIVDAGRILGRPNVGHSSAGRHHAASSNACYSAGPSPPHRDACRSNRITHCSAHRSCANANSRGRSASKTGHSNGSALPILTAAVALMILPPL